MSDAPASAGVPPVPGSAAAREPDSLATAPSAGSVGTAPPAVSAAADARLVTVLEARSGLVPIDLPELWRYRELLWILAMRDVKVRYAQSALGLAWAVLQPLATMATFALLFGVLMGAANRPTVEGVPYAVSTFCALVPWQLFAKSLAGSSNSLVANQNLITKVYFPRLIAPLAPVVAAFVDFAIALGVLLLLQLAYGIVPGVAILTLPFFAALAGATALAVSLWTSALNALYRDVGQIVPFFIQILMFASPVVYTTDSVLAGQPAWARVLYALNPLAGVIEGFRWALLGAAPPPVLELAASVCAVAALLVGGLYFFRSMERTFADVV